jgi:hypothetical protein
MVIRGDGATISVGKQTFEVEIRVNTAARSKQIEIIERSAGPSPRLAAEFNGEPIIVSLALMLADDVEYTNSHSRPPIASSRPIPCIGQVPQARGAHQAGVFDALGEAVRTLRGRDAQGTEIAFDGFGR